LLPVLIFHCPFSLSIYFLWSSHSVLTTTFFPSSFIFVPPSTSY
jgi:hypothetical protein